MTTKTVQHVINFAFWDVVYLSILIFLSLFFVSFLFNATYLSTGYQDWIVHAFRVKSLSESGFSSWSHVWSNGISLWKAYQFIPHFITLATSSIFQVEIPRAMVLVTIGQFVLLRVFIYVALRILHAHPIVAFVCSVLSFDIAQYWGGVTDYSLVFGFTLFPLVLVLWVKFMEGKLQYLFPYIVGLLFYVHILLGVVSMGLMVTAIVFSRRKIISGPVFMQFLLALASSSIFWVPIVLKTSYSYSSAEYANRYFLNLAISRFSFYGLSFAIILCYCIAFFRVLMPVSKNFHWSRFLFLFVSGYFLLVIVGASVDLPRIISQFQFTRGITYLGIGILFIFAPVVEQLRRLKSITIKGILLFGLCLAVIEGMWFASIYSPQPSNSLSEPVSTFIKKSKKDLSDGRIWTPALDRASYFMPSSYKMPYSYMAHLESNQVAQRLARLANTDSYQDLVPKSSIDRLSSYFKTTGVKYLFLEGNSPFVKSYQEIGFSELGRVDLDDTFYTVLQVPWQKIDATLVHPDYKKSLVLFPSDLEFSDTNDQIELDEYIKEFSETIYNTQNTQNTQNTPIQAYYPDQETIQLSIPEKRNSNLVYVNESYDSSWKAYFHNKVQNLQPAGPNFMLLTLDNFEKGGTISLVHSWPFTFYTSLYLIILIPISIFIWDQVRRIHHSRDIVKL